MSLFNWSQLSSFANRVSSLTSPGLRLFHTQSPSLYRDKVKQSFSSLQKHKRPDNLTGSERRRKLVKDHKKERFVAKPVSKSTRGFMPSRFKLEGIPSDAKLPKRNQRQPEETLRGTSSGLNLRTKGYETLSSIKKYQERSKKRMAHPKIPMPGLDEITRPTTKFDMADLETLDVVEQDKENASGFESMGLHKDLLQAIYSLFPDQLSKNQPVVPTNVQSLAISELLRNRPNHVLCASETGSGKTLSYLIPMIQILKEQEELERKNLLIGGNIQQTESAKLPKKKNVDFGDDSVDPFKNGTIPALVAEKTESVLKHKEMRLLSTTSLRKLNRPRAVILVPSCALADQIYAIAKKLSHSAKFRVILITRSTVRKDMLRRLTLPIDILITTPASLQRHLADTTLSLSELQLLTIDEADTMFEKGFNEDVLNLIRGFRRSNANQNRPYQLMMVSATLPKLLLQTLNQEFTDLVRITTPSLHKALPSCKQHFIDLKDYKGNRTLGLLDVLRQFEQRASATPLKKQSDRTIIFCNTRKAVTIVQAFLKERKIDCLSLYGGEPYTHQPPATDDELKAFIYPQIKNQRKSVYEFNTPDRVKAVKPLVKSTKQTEDEHDEDNREEPEEEKEPTANSTKKPANNPKILISTDLASRGMDTTHVNHVILFDFPTAVVDYLHRIGRTARAGQSGTVTSLIGKRDRMLSERIRQSVRSQTVLS